MPWDLSNTSRGISRGTSAKQTLQDMSASAAGDLGDVGATGSTPIPTFGDSPAAARAETPPPNPRRHWSLGCYAPILQGPPPEDPEHITIVRHDGLGFQVSSL